MGFNFNSTLPDGLLPETDVEGMRLFLSNIVTPHVHESFFIQMKVGAGLVIVLAILQVAILIRRLLSRSAWLWQLYETARGTFLIPNAVMSLVLVLFIYAIAFEGWAFVQCGFYHGTIQKGWLLWRELPFILTWTAAFWSSAGLVSAFPDALRLRGGEVGLLQRALLRPSVFNSALLGGPLLCSVSLLIPSLIGNRQFNAMVPRHKSWIVKAAEPNASVAELAVEAREIWLGIVHAYWYDSITFGVWFIWGCILLIVSSSIAVHVLLRVRVQVKLAEKRQEALSKSQQTFYLFSSRPNFGRPLNARAEIASSTGERALSANTVVDRGQGRASATFGGSQEEVDKEVELVKVMQTETNSVMFPAQKQAQPSEKLTKIQAATRRSTALKLVYRNLILQHASIVVGTGSFSALSCWTCLTSYSSIRENRHSPYHEAGSLISLWTSVISGVAILGAVAWRTFDTNFVLKSEHEHKEEELELPPSPPYAYQAHSSQTVPSHISLQSTIDSMALPSGAVSSGASSTVDDAEPR